MKTTQRDSLAYAAGYKAALLKAEAICKAAREAHIRSHGQSRTDAAVMATVCARAIRDLLDEPVPGGWEEEK